MINLKGEKILLRALEPNDLDIIYDWENDVSAWVESGNLVPISKYSVESYINTQDDIYSSKNMKLIIEADKKVVGHIDIFEFEPVNRRAGVGLLVTEDERNKGYAGDALDVLIIYGFDVLRLHQIYCNIVTDNEISLKLFKKHGFEIIGCKKDWVQIANVWKDVYMLQLINDEKSI